MWPCQLQPLQRSHRYASTQHVSSSVMMCTSKAVARWISSTALKHVACCPALSVSCPRKLTCCCWCCWCRWCCLQPAMQAELWQHGYVFWCSDNVWRLCAHQHHPLEAFKSLMRPGQQHTLQVRHWHSDLDHLKWQEYLSWSIVGVQHVQAQPVEVVGRSCLPGYPLCCSSCRYDRGSHDAP